jgi:3-oxoacyl-[acyl-carrier-protein] synthase II
MSGQLPAPAVPKARAVITGIGLVSPLGNDIDSFWAGLTAGRSAVSALPDELRGGLPCWAGALVKDFDFARYVDGPWVRRPRGRLPLFVQYALGACASAIRHAGIDPAAVDPARFGLVIGNGAGGIPYIVPHVETLRERGWSRVDPQVLLQLIPNTAVAHAAVALGARGYNATIVAACASGTQAIGEAYRAVASGLADVVLAGGTEAWLTEAGLISFALMGALSRWSGDPARASRPFDKDRSGFVPAEGAAILVIEEQRHALRRGAQPLAEIRGYACTNDAYHIVAPDPQGQGAAHCIRLALHDAGVVPEEIDYINAHGTGTQRGDIAETKAIKTALGPHSASVPISATKSMIGHSMGAAGALEAAACVQTLLTGVIHPTINLESPDPQCDLDYVPKVARRRSVRTVLKNSFGFGGHNACLVLASAAPA